MIVVVSGLPGTGKTTVALLVAERLGAVHVSIDALEDALLGAGLPTGWTTGVAAYETARVVAEQNLVLGHTIIVDAVNDSEPARETWRRTARAAGAALRFVVLRLDDPEQHRLRLLSRGNRFLNLPEPSWEQVAARAAAYEPWSDDHLVVDAARPVEQVVADVLSSLQS